MKNEGTNPEREARTAERISDERDGRKEAGGAAAAAGGPVAEVRESFIDCLEMDMIALGINPDREKLAASLDNGSQNSHGWAWYKLGWHNGQVALLAHPPSPLPAPEPVAEIVAGNENLGAVRFLGPIPPKGTKLYRGPL